MGGIGNIYDVCIYRTRGYQTVERALEVEQAGIEADKSGSVTDSRFDQ